MNKSLFLLINITTSLTSLYFQLLITKEFSQLTGQEHLFQALSLGIYLLMMGLGSSYTKKLKNKWTILQKVIFSELGILMSGASTLLILFFYLFITTKKGVYTPISPQELRLLPLILICSISVGFLGFFTGIQLPLFLSYTKDHKGLILFLNYLGALAAGPLLNHLILMSYKLFDLTLVAIIISTFTLVTLLFLERKIILFGLLLIPTSLFSLNNQGPFLQGAFLESYYLGLKTPQWQDLFKENSSSIGSVEVLRSPYQDIHLITERPVKNSIENGNFTLSLNFRPQFDLQSSRTYHESMLWGGLNLRNNDLTKNILILGGGDGILAQLIQSKIPKSQITLVELDPLMIKVSKRNPFIRILNKEVFNNLKNIELISDDALHFLKVSKEKLYDAIFIDFPYPYSDELLGLYSKEFYGLVHKRLTKEGFIVIDFPVVNTKDKKSHLTKRFIQTLHKAKFGTVFSYGPYSAFIYAQKNKEEVSFKYSNLPRDLHLSTYLNLVELKPKNYPESSPLKEISLFYGL